MKKLAWIGTGVMGKPMALHLAKAGYEVTVFNRTLSKAKDLGDEVKVATTIKDCVSDADVVFTIVGFPEDVKEVYLSQDGILNHAKENAIVIDMTTSSPTLAKEIYSAALNKGIRALDAPVTGGDKGAREATLSIMVGGQQAVYQEVSELLEILGSTVTYMGPAGNGQHAKLANQICIAGAISTTAEALSYAKKHNLDLTLMLRVINNGSASSWQSQNNGPKMMVHDKQPGFFIKHFIKDLRLAMQEKESLNLPVLEQVLSEYESLLDQDYGDYGTQAIIDYYSEK